MRSACSQRLAIGAMGTRFELVIAGVEGSFAPARVRATGEDTLELVREWHGRLNLFDRGSLISHLNARAAERGAEGGGGWVRVDRDMAGLLGACARLWRQTDGAFDPSVGAVMRRRGLQERAGVGGVKGERWGFGNVEVDEEGCRVRFREPGIELDLGGIAKGLVLDRVGEALREAAVTSALVHGGTSSVVAIGSAPGGEAWTVALGREDGPRVTLNDAAMSVSAGRVVEGRRVGHVVDPRTGEIGGAERCACVVGASAMECEAWSTALLVLGERPPGMERELTSAVRATVDGAWWVEGAEAWRISNVPEGVAVS